MANTRACAQDCGHRSHSCGEEAKVVLFK